MAPPIFHRGDRERQVRELLQKRGPLTCYQIAHALQVEPFEISDDIARYVRVGILKLAGFSSTPAHRPGPRRAKIYELSK